MYFILIKTALKTNGAKLKYTHTHTHTHTHRGSKLYIEITPLVSLYYSILFHNNYVVLTCDILINSWLEITSLICCKMETFFVYTLTEPTCCHLSLQCHLTIQFRCRYRNSLKNSRTAISHSGYRLQLGTRVLKTQRFGCCDHSRWWTRSSWSHHSWYNKTDN
jgi:hypothetical protein